MSNIKPIRGVVTFAVDEQHIRRPPAQNPDLLMAQPVEFCVIKRSGISLWALRERLMFQKEIPLPSGATYAKRTGRYLCFADKENYNIVDLHAASSLPLLPLSQVGDPSIKIKPSITVISENEFLMLSWTGAGTLGLFITGDGDPVRGTLEWTTYPETVCLNYPHIVALFPDGTIETHSVETQLLEQTIATTSDLANRKKLVWSAGGFSVPSAERKTKLSRTSVPLLRSPPANITLDANPGQDNVAEAVDSVPPELSI